MPQPPTGNMGLIRPSDKGDGDQWDKLLDDMFQQIDQHNHADGSGAQIHIASIAIDADINFSDALAVKHAIYNLKAIDFFPTPTSSIASFAGALFLADGSGGTVANELYWRTTSGGNVQMTSGGTLNVNAFTGGIGGDYGIVQALESFDDATDAYVFQQQIGAAVRQYAKVRHSDMILYEFKAVGVTPVPAPNITLKVPAGLVNTFALTLPGALPAAVARAPLFVDSTGAIAFGAVETIQLPPNWKDGLSPWRFATITASYVVPIPLRNGDRIVAVRARFKDNVTGPTKLTVGLQSVVDGTASTVATSAQSAGTGAVQTLAAAGLTTTIASGTNYQVLINVVTGSANCELYWVEVDFDRP